MLDVWRASEYVSGACLTLIVPAGKTMDFYNILTHILTHLNQVLKQITDFLSIFSFMANFTRETNLTRETIFSLMANLTRETLLEKLYSSSVLEKTLFPLLARGTLWLFHMLNIWVVARDLFWWRFLQPWNFRWWTYSPRQTK